MEKMATWQNLTSVSSMVGVRTREGSQAPRTMLAMARCIQLNFQALPFGLEKIASAKATQNASGYSRGSSWVPASAL
jgi:hypothetical protein